MQRYDSVLFQAYNGEINEMETVCTVSLVNGKLVYEGKQADECKKMVKQSDYLEPFRKIGGYTLLAELCHAFQGSYFWATPVKEATIL